MASKWQHSKKATWVWLLMILGMMAVDQTPEDYASSNVMVTDSRRSGQGMEDMSVAPKPSSGTLSKCLAITTCARCPQRSFRTQVQALLTSPHNVSKPCARAVSDFGAARWSPTHICLRLCPVPVR
jgi:hypothetical protein